MHYNREDKHEIELVNHEQSMTIAIFHRSELNSEGGPGPAKYVHYARMQYYIV